jgi:hypothetical protein
MEEPDVEKMSEEELDAELRKFGLDPHQVVQNAFDKLCLVMREQSMRIATLEAQIRALQESNVLAVSQASDSKDRRISELEAQLAAWMPPRKEAL